MRDTIKLIAKQIHEMLPEHRIAITRFNSEYKYGQLYLGELDRSITRDLMRRTFATESEKELLVGEINKRGYRWNPETKELVNLNENKNENN